MYNYQAPGQYGHPPPQYGAPPGMPPPPGMAAPPGLLSSPAPGVAPPPGATTSSSPARQGFPPNYQQTALPSNINFNAPVIRLGTTASTNLGGGMNNKGANAANFASNRAGAGSENLEHRKQQVRNDMAMMQPPNIDETRRTVFLGKIPEWLGDENVERIVRCAGDLKRWIRITDASGKAQTFGFAEYADVKSLDTAIAILGQGVEVPAQRVEVKVEDEKAEKTRILVMIDEKSREYAEDWKERLKTDANERAFLIDQANIQLSGVIASLFRPQTYSTDAHGDTNMMDADVKADPITGEVVMIPLSAEDELSDIPAEMRETVAAEIARFRDRSNKNDMKRLREEEEREAAHRRASMARPSGLGSPPHLAPTGPAGGANGIPLGPRGDRGIHGAPSGPKGFGAQIPKDYQNGVTFVNGNGLDISWITLEDDDTDASDSEVERRRKKKFEDEEEKAYLDAERRWINRERQKEAAMARQKEAEAKQKAERERKIKENAERLKNWNDDEEANRKRIDYYADRSLWLREREVFRRQEVARDDQDRRAEERENNREREGREPQHRGTNGTKRHAEQPAEAPREPQRFKIALGAAAAKQQTAPSRRTAAEVEDLLANEEDTSNQPKRELKPIKFDTAAEAASLTDEEREQAQKQLAAEIPSDTEGLFNFPVAWEFVGEKAIKELRTSVEKKIMEYLGIQEDFLVDAVVEHIRNRGSAQELVSELEGPLEEMASELVKRVWRILIFYSEAEKRGISD